MTTYYLFFMESIEVGLSTSGFIEEKTPPKVVWLVTNTTNRDLRDTDFLEKHEILLNCQN